MTSMAPVSSTHRRCPAVYREAVFGDLRSAPQICPEVVRSIFVTFGTSFKYSNVSFYFFNVQNSRYAHLFAGERRL